MANRLKKEQHQSGTKSKKNTSNQSYKGLNGIPDFKKEPKEYPINTIYMNRKYRIVGLAIIFFSVLLFLAIISFVFSWKEDFDRIESAGFYFLFTNTIAVNNIMGRVGLWVAYYSVYIGFGLPSVIFSWIGLLIGGKLFFKNFKYFTTALISFYIACMLYSSVLLAFIFQSSEFLYGGYVGLILAQWLANFMGNVGLIFLLLICFLGYIFWLNNWIFNYEMIKKNLFKILSPPSIRKLEDEQDIKMSPPASQTQSSPQPSQSSDIPLEIQNADNEPAMFKEEEEKKADSDAVNKINANYEFEKINIHEESGVNSKVSDENHLLDIELVEHKLKELVTDKQTADLPTIVETTVGQETLKKVMKPNEQKEAEIEFDVAIAQSLEEEHNQSKKLGESIVESNDVYQFPPTSILKQYDTEEISFDQQELESNKLQIIQTLKNFKINIQKIAATIGPTVTLYEIIPEDGTRISKIKNLEDDIALSLSALGIRIIAPMPGKGTIGIEVPNKQKKMVSLKKLLHSKKFADSDYILPVAFGKAIDNTDFIVDLAKMPHVLMAGATGQGKSVGLNTLLVSLLYKKDPRDLKLVLVDPKKVELSLFRKLEKHFLAKLPGEEEPIITDTKKVINVLNALCIEMDNRYDMLKEAYCKNIEEYNKKIKDKKLTLGDMHAHLPYIVIVIDEFADLIMTAGKEVELPIARIAQLARAVGLHLVIATQRPSVNIITGMIKANFPARIAFKVSSKVDSRTILDEGGAEQLVGKGDMLVSSGSGLIRLQCAFVDTSEVENVCDFISQQISVDGAYLLPEVANDESEERNAYKVEDRDPLFEEAARLVVTTQSGSTSFIQRKMRLGFNRAGRLMDQFEALGIVSSPKGAKARDVLIKTEVELDTLLRNLDI